MIVQQGLKEVQLPDTLPLPDVNIIAPPSRKRKANVIRDSEDEDDLEGSDEDYGWAQEDDGELPQPPPQWQGSEDILVPGIEDIAEQEEDDGSSDHRPGDEVEADETLGQYRSDDEK
jgi:hypothetical protein